MNLFCNQIYTHKIFHFKLLLKAKKQGTLNDTASVDMFFLNQLTLKKEVKK